MRKGKKKTPYAPHPSRLHSIIKKTDVNMEDCLVFVIVQKRGRRFFVPFFEQFFTNTWQFSCLHLFF